jgi:hypothetical protein
MKYIRNLIPILFLGFIGCKEEIKVIKSSEVSITAPQFLSTISERNSDGSDFANVYVLNNEYISNDLSKVYSTCSASFKDEESSSLKFVGNLQINDDIIENNSVDNRYLVERGIIPSFELGSISKLKLNSNTEEFKSFEENIYLPKPLNAQSSIGKNEYFDLNSDLLLNWNNDDKFSSKLTYVAVCCEGIPVLFKMVESKNSIIIPKSEFSNFKRGKRIFLMIGKGTQRCIEQSNGKNICIYTISYAKSVGYTTI